MLRHALAGVLRAVADQIDDAAPHDVLARLRRLAATLPHDAATPPIVPAPPERAPGATAGATDTLYGSVRCALCRGLLFLAEPRWRDRIDAGQLRQYLSFVGHASSGPHHPLPGDDGREICEWHAAQECRERQQPEGAA